MSPEPSARRARIILNADDFGLSAGVNAGILALLARRRLSALSVMSGAPLWRSDGPRLAPFRDAADIGLHFSLTEVRPLGSDGLHRRDGTPFSFGDVQAAAWRRRLDARVIAEELRLQWGAFVDVLGQPPAHLDSHQHVHQLPVVREAVLAFVESLPAGERPYVRTAVERTSMIVRRGVNSVRAVAFAIGGRKLRRELVARRWRTNDGFSGVYDFRASGYRPLFQRFLRGVRNTTIVLCHPASGAAQPGDPIGAARLSEFAYFSSDAMTEDLAAARVEIGRFA